MGPTSPSVIETLTGSFLISTPKMPDPRFEQQVIYICAHSEEGAMGVAINKPNVLFTIPEVLRGAQPAGARYRLSPCIHWRTR